MMSHILDQILLGVIVFIAIIFIIYVVEKAITTMKRSYVMCEIGGYLLVGGFGFFVGLCVVFAIGSFFWLIGGVILFIGGFAS